MRVFPATGRIGCVEIISTVAYIGKLKNDNCVVAVNAVAELMARWWRLRGTIASAAVGGDDRRACPISVSDDYRRSAT